MKVYESVCILSPSLSDDDVSKVIQKISDTIVQAEASILNVINEGKKKLAYDVQHERRGTYLIIQFQGKGNAVNELERFHRMEDAIMKFLTVEISPELVRPTGEEVEKTEVGAG